MGEDKKRYIDYSLIVIGTGLLSFAIQCVYDPCSLVVGGFSGIAIIIKEVTKMLVPGGVPLWLTNILLNVPVFLLAWKIKGRQFVGRTIIATILVSLWLYIIPPFSFAGNSLFLASIFGGVISGAGLGFVFMAKATTGGTDMVGAIIQHYFKHISMPTFMMLLDAIIVTVGAYIFGLERALYAVISIYVVAKVSDGMLEGIKFAKETYIITDKHKEVADAILNEIDRGVTGIYAKGMYTETERYLLFCVVTKKELIQLKEIVGRIDENAFVIVSDAREVLGEGFLPVE